MAHSTTSDPHADQPVVRAGPAPEDAAATLILLHGRGGTADSMLDLYQAIGLPQLAAIAPQASGHTWYPQSFLAPMEMNQPYLDSALRQIESLVADLEQRGVGAEQVALLGFSQGACLTCEFVARNPRRYGAVMALTGGLIGPPGTPRNYAGSLSGTSVFLGTSDRDPHVPFQRVAETRDTFMAMGANVELRRYAGMPHTINDDELSACRRLLQSMLQKAGK